MLQVNHISKRREDFHLEDISFELPDGYIMGLVGENGAGKTTLLQIILQLIKPDQGEAACDRDKMGFVLAEELFDRGNSLLQNADFYGKFYQEYSRKEFLRYAEEFELDIHRKLRKLSRGERLKFQFAFALSHRPQLLILDEPTASFDPEFREKFQTILTSFVSDGSHSVILATHLTSELDRIADYVLFLHQGKQEFYLDREALADKYRLVSGEHYKIRLLPKDRVIGVQKGEYATRALIRHSRFDVYDSQVSVEIPTIEDIMYYTLKGGKI